MKSKRTLVLLGLLASLCVGTMLSAGASWQPVLAAAGTNNVASQAWALTPSHSPHQSVAGQQFGPESKPGVALQLGPEKTNLPGAVPGIYYLDYGYNTIDPTHFPVDGSIRFWTWQALNPAPGVYDWPAMDSWLAARKALGLKTGMLITTYDGIASGDIRSTPDYVIETPDAVVPVNVKDTTTPHYVPIWPYQRNYTYNANFDATDHRLGWTLAGNADIVSNPPVDPVRSAAGWAAKLGGANNATDSLYHAEQRFPAMPPDLAGTVTAFVSVRVYISTTDPNPNDHLLIELWDQSNIRIGTANLDITNKSHPNNTWRDYSFDISSIAHKRSVRVAFKVITDGANPTTFYVDNVSPMVRHLVPYYHGKNWATTKSSPYLGAYRIFIQALGDHLRDNPDMQFVAIGTGVFSENQPVEDQFNYVMTGVGMTSAIWTEYVNEVTTAYVNAFSLEPDQGLRKELLLQYAPIFLSAAERRDQTDFAAARGVGPSANFLMADNMQAYNGSGTAAFDPIDKWWRQVPVAFENYATDLCNPLLVYWAVVGSLDKHVDYLRTAEYLLRDPNGLPSMNTPVYEWAQEYIGKQPDEASSVWAVMREHRNPTRLSCRGDSSGLWYLHTGSVATDYYSIPHSTGAAYAELGNFEFYLYQVDTIPGGRTVPETNDKGADSRYARDPSTGNPMPQAGLGNCPPSGYDEAMYGPNYACNYRDGSRIG